MADAAASVDVDAYLRRINFTDAVAVDHETLRGLQLAHLKAVPFENLDVYARLRVRTDTAWSVSKVIEHERGGWCFELNGAFAALLEALGFPVVRLAAAVLLDGPTTVVDHLALEVGLDEPYLVDVGFGESFVSPLALNRAGPQDDVGFGGGGSGTYEFLASPQGTTLTRHVDGVPAAQYRFKRVAHQMSDFDAASDHLQSDPELPWSQKPFATRLLGSGADRVTLLRDRLKLHVDGELTETPVAAEDWAATLAEWFAMEPPPGMEVGG